MLRNPDVITRKYFKAEPVLDESPLEELRLGRSPIGDAVAVAGFLSCVFPNLTEICGHWRSIQELLDQWSEGEFREIIAEAECRAAWHWVVDSALPEFRQIRDSERNQYRRASVDEATSDV